MLGIYAEKDLTVSGEVILHLRVVGNDHGV